MRQIDDSLTDNMYIIIDTCKVIRNGVEENNSKENVSEIVSLFGDFLNTKGNPVNEEDLAISETDGLYYGVWNDNSKDYYEDFRIFLEEKGIEIGEGQL